MIFTDCFSATYQNARGRFVKTARAAGAVLASYEHPSARGIAGEVLSIDVAHLGNRSAARQLVVISGTHGQEGYAGSAAQIGWLLRHGRSALLENAGVVLIHGLNPYGFSHGSRTTENNVDLNRNFVDHAGPHPANPGYEVLHEALTPASWTQDALAATADAERRFAAEHGADALFGALVSGQYDHADGLMFGGAGREWSNLTLETILQQHAGHASKVALIEWHTGIGAYGQPFFLSFNEPGSQESAQAVRWWGDAVLGARPHGMVRPDYKGLVFFGVQAFLPDTQVAGAVIEFGTRGPEPGAVAMRLDRWLRFHGAQVDEDTRLMLQADLRDSLDPASYVWRESVLAHGIALTHDALTGLSQW